MDNVVGYGKVSALEYSDPWAEGVRALLKSLQNDPDVEATTIATVGKILQSLAKTWSLTLGL